MSPSKIEKLFVLMKQYGVSHFKTLELEINMETAAVEKPGGHHAIPNETAGSSTVAPPPQAIPTVEVSIPHHVNEVSNLLKLNDNDLVDKLFPDYTQMPPKDGN